MPVVDAEEAALYEAALAADRAEGRPVDSEGATKPEPPAPPEKAAEEPQSPAETPDTTESEPESPPPKVEDKERDEKGRFKSKEGEPDTNGEKPSVTVPERPKSQYALAREREEKDAIRGKFSWSKLQEEKEAFKAQQAEWEEKRRREELQAQAQQKPIEKDGISLQEYHKWYQTFRQQALQNDAAGDYVKSAEEWRKTTQSLETVLQLELEARQRQEQNMLAQYELAWRTDLDQAIAQNPDVGNPDSDLYQLVDEIVGAEPGFYTTQNGVHKAVRYAQLLLNEAQNDWYRDQYETMRAQMEQHQHSSQPLRGGPGKPPQGPKNVDDMSIEEFEAHLRRESQILDDAMRR